MATWSVKPIRKKSIIERNYLRKDGQTIFIETCWRSGEFTVETDDDMPPNIKAGVDIYNCGYSTELVETDGNWCDFLDMDGCDKKTQKWLEDFLEENTWFDLEEHGWIDRECETIIDCDLLIQRM